MDFLNNEERDACLNSIRSNVTSIHICTSLLTDYANLASVTKGNKQNPTIEAPTDGDVDGRKIVVNTFSDGVVTDSLGFTVGFWSLIFEDAETPANSRVISSGVLSAPITVPAGQSQFQLTALQINFPDQPISE